MPRQSMVTCPSSVSTSSNHSQPVAPKALKPPPRFTIAKTCQVEGAAEGWIALTTIVPTGNAALPAFGMRLT